MSIPFKQIPANLRVPLFYAELDASKANTAVQAQRTLIIGPKTTAGTATPGVPVLSQGVADARAAAGLGSILAEMVWAYRQNDSFGEVWILPVSDDANAVAAAGSITFTGPATATGAISLYIAGQLISVTIPTGTNAISTCNAVAAAINVASNLPVIGVQDGTVGARLNIIAKNRGLAGNDIDIRFNYRGTAGGEAFPAGIGATIVPMAGGAVNPSLAGALTTLGDVAFDFIVSPFTDAASVAAIGALLNDTTGRWSWQTQVYGHQFIAVRGTSSTLATYGTSLNDQHLSCMGFADSPSPAWNWAAACAGAAAASLRADPGVPLQTVSVAGVLAPPLASRFNLSQRNVLLFGGISTFRVDQGGTVSIENMITTYQTNPLGQPDNSYLEIETMFLLTFVLRRLSTLVSSKYARVKLAADGTRTLPGSNVVTPNTIRADLIAAYQQMEAEGYVQQSDVFAKALMVEKDAQNPNRVNVLFPGILINQLRVFALLNQFRLS